MKSLKIFIAAIVVVSLSLAGYFFFTPSPQSPGLPTLSPRSFESSPSKAYLSLLKSVREYQGKIAEKPGIISNYVALARIFLQESRISGKHHEYIPKAEQVLEMALARKPNDFSAMITRASIFLTKHQFQKAKDVARRAIAINPRNAFARGVLTDALVELGEYDAAVQSCDEMLAIRPDLRSYSRAAYLRELHGQQNGAIAAMQMAADAGAPGYEDRAWAFYQLGNLYLEKGALDTATFIYRGILDERPHYAFAMSGLARVFAARRAYDRAIEMLVKAIQISPEHLFLEQLATIYRTLGQPENAAVWDKSVLQAYRQHEAGGWNVDLEFARFSLDNNIDLPEALRRAATAYQRRPENIDVLDTYAWALYKNGRAADALPLMKKALRLHTRRAKLFYHAGVIFQAAGKPNAALTFLERALSVNPFLPEMFSRDIHQRVDSLKKLAALN